MARDNFIAIKANDYDRVFGKKSRWNEMGRQSEKTYLVCFKTEVRFIVNADNEEEAKKFAKSDFDSVSMESMEDFSPDDEVQFAIQEDRELIHIEEIDKCYSNLVGGRKGE